MKTERIQIGDSVVMQNATYFEEFNGCIGIVVDEMGSRVATDLRTMEQIVVTAYRVQLAPDFVVIAEPHQLRRLHGPEDIEAVEDAENIPEEIDA